METQPPLSPPPHAVRVVLGTVLRVVATITAVFVAYSLVPGTRGTTSDSLVIFVAALGAFAVQITLEICSVLRATYSALRAIEVIAVMFPIFVVAFAIIYLRMSQISGQTFNHP
jgi:hypothetical protein